MRGNQKPTKELALSGRCYIQNYNNGAKAEAGDVLLCPQIENKSNYLIEKDTYHITGLKGYLRAYVYTGKVWGILNSVEVFLDKENNYSKTDLIIDVADICTVSIAKLAGTKIYRTYRDHYTIHEYKPNPFKGKKGHLKKV